MQNDVKCSRISTKDKDIQSMIDEFQDVMTDEFPKTPMAGPDMRIDLDHTKDIQPKKVYKARPVPLHWMEEAKRTVDQFVKDGIIEEVFDDTTDWVSPAFFVPKG